MLARCGLLSAAVLAVVVVAVPANATPYRYQTRLTVNNAGNSALGMILPEDVSTGDLYDLSFTIDPFASQMSGPSGPATFTNVLLSFGITPGLANTGTFVPNGPNVTGNVNATGDGSQTALTCPP